MYFKLWLLSQLKSRRQNATRELLGEEYFFSKGCDSTGVDIKASVGIAMINKTTGQLSMEINNVVSSCKLYANMHVSA